MIRAIVLLVLAFALAAPLRTQACGYHDPASINIVMTFGESFAARIDETEPGAWTGPIASSYGLHLVRVRSRVPGALPPLAAIRPAVER